MLEARHSIVRTLLLCVTAAALGVPAPAHSGEDATKMPPEYTQALATIKTRIRESLLASAPNAEQAAAWAKALQDDGTWKDVDYKNQDNTHWKPAQHLARIRQMAVALCRPGSPAKDDPALKAATLKAFGCWLKHDYPAPQWWWHDIGVPMAVYQIAVLLEADLTPAQLAKTLVILERGKIDKTGQNLVWLSDITLARGCLAGNSDLVKSAAAAIAKEIRVTSAEGIQADWSFHQHGAQLYSGGYGKGFSTDTARVAYLVHGTPFAMPVEKIEILRNYLLEGQQWMIRGARFDYSAIGREIVRPGHNAKSQITACEHLAALGDAKKDALQAFAARLKGDAAPGAKAPEGNRLFWRSDFMTHCRTGWYASVRTASNRLIGTELINNENLCGDHLFEGANYLMRSGDEYFDIFSVWDWAHVPGVTAEHPLKPSGAGRHMGKTPFAGGASDGTYGVFGYVLSREGLMAHKAWFFFDDLYVCLGAGITRKDGGEVHTAVNQCLAKGKVTYGTDAAPKTLAGQAQNLAAPAWVHHDGVGYVFPKAGAIQLHCGNQNGNWNRISKTLSKDQVTLPVFHLWLSHGKAPQNADYAYLVVPGADPAGTAKRMAQPGVEILANALGVQAVRHSDLKLIQAVFFAKGSFTVEGLTVSADRPCALVCRPDANGWRVTAGSPAHEKGALKIQIDTNGKSFAVALDLPAGASVTKNAAARP